MPRDIPTFGSSEPGLDYVHRPGAYALIERDGKLLIVDENSGWFLPGGGLEGNETPLEALRREMIEETGFRIEAPSPVVVAREFVISKTDGTPYVKECHIFGARLADRTETGDCELQWVTPSTAIDKLYHECFRWLVEQQFLGRLSA